MTDEQMQKLRDEIMDGINSYFEDYDWDKAFKRYLEGKDEGL